MNISNLTNGQAGSVEFTNGFFLDIENIIVCTSDGYAYLFALPEK
jgi:hypothetical protein